MTGTAMIGTATTGESMTGTAMTGTAMTGTTPTGTTPRSRWAWGVLLALLALLVLGALAGRRDWPSLVGDEATYRMQAESLAWDFDLIYTRHDYERFVALAGEPPEGLILQSGDRGGHITFGKPFFYAVFLAPFVRLMPTNGPFLANALLLALACVAAARTLERRIGTLAPLAVAVFVFASVAFLYAFWAHADLFLASCSALALALALDRERSGWREAGRWLAVGLLLAVVGFSRPMYLTLFLPAVAAVPRRRRSAWVVAGGLALILAAAAIHHALADSWTAYGASRRGFYSYTGFPDVDFDASEWTDNLATFGNHAWLGLGDTRAERRVVPSLWAWNAVYFLLGQHVGLVPYFLPFLLSLRGRPRGRIDWSLAIAVIASVAAFFYLRPFNFYGGGAAVGNRYFLPLYPALWFLPRKPLRPWPLAAVALAAGVFLWPSWTAPRGYPLWQDDHYRYAGVARKVLPFETTQSHLKPSGREDVIHHGLWVKFLDRHVRRVREKDQIRLEQGREAQMLVGFGKPLEALEVEVCGRSKAVEFDAEEPFEEIAAAEGPCRRFRLTLGSPRARHPMWWTWEPFWLYRVGLRAEDPGGGRPVRVRLWPVVAEPSLSLSPRNPGP